VNSNKGSASEEENSIASSSKAAVVTVFVSLVQECSESSWEVVPLIKRLRADITQSAVTTINSFSRDLIYKYT
jgi:hypothetical protein